MPKHGPSWAGSRSTTGRCRAAAHLPWRPRRVQYLSTGRPPYPARGAGQRHFGIAGLIIRPPGSRGCPWGCGFRAVWDKSNALWGSTRYGTGGSAGSAPAFEESASAAMVGAHAAPIPPARPATLPEFRRGAFAPALRICSPAWIVQDPVPPQGPMAEKPRGRALQRARIVGNPVPL